MALPSIFIDRASCIYILVKDVAKELEDFILTGKTKTREIHVFPHDREQSVISDWAQLGYDVAYCSQRIDYMDELATIKYLKAHNPNTGVSVSLIPWFLIPGRPYLVFVYAYAIWHYHITGKKSLKETALATGKLFKIRSINKSTVSRSIKAMEGFIEVSAIDRDRAATGQGASSGQAGGLPGGQAEETCEDAIGRATEILTGWPSIEYLEEAYRGNARQLPGPVNAKAAGFVISAVPTGHSQIIIHSEPGRRKNLDARKRPPRPRNKKTQPVQHHLRFVDFSQREKIRKEFIEICKHFVLDAATTYHRFLV